MKFIFNIISQRWTELYSSVILEQKTFMLGDKQLGDVLQYISQKQQ